MSPSRTIVISDVHGRPELISNALLHAGYRREDDQLVFAGDFVDRGPDAAGCLRLLEQAGARMLLGNHELAVLLGFRVFDQSTDSLALRRTLLDRVLPAGSGGWQVATEADGVLISHAGISDAYEGLWQEVQQDPARLAERLNRLYLEAVRRELETGCWDEDGILGDEGPLWFRPRPWGRAVPLAGLAQVAGHTRPMEELEPEGFFMVDPGSHRCARVPGLYRYAVIAGGRVHLESGSLDEASGNTGAKAGVATSEGPQLSVHAGPLAVDLVGRGA